MIVAQYFSYIVVAAWTPAALLFANGFLGV
jgi:hypothetical protein